MKLIETLRQVVRFIKRAVGYEKVTVIKVKKHDDYYNHVNADIKINKEWRKYYQVDVKSLIWNLKNYAKFLMRGAYQKDMHGKPYYKHVYTFRKCTSKKDDFAIIRKPMVEIAKQPMVLHKKKIGYIDRIKFNKGE